MRVAPGPAGETEADKVTLPENPFSPVKVTLVVPEDPWPIVNEFGSDETVKSGAGATWNVRDAEWLRLPLTPITVTV